MPQQRIYSRRFRWTANHFRMRIITVILASFFLLLVGSPLKATKRFVRQAAEKKEVREKKELPKEEKEKKISLNEEIVVIGQSPREAALASVTLLRSEEIQLNQPSQLAEVIKQAPGVSVSLNGKNEFTLRLRGMESQRVTLLIDGVPVYEPFFASFDLKTLPASGVEAVQITTGAASALYGPNTLAGVVNVITRRPSPESLLRLSASLGELKTTGFSLEGSKLLGRIGAATSLNYQNSDGFYYFDGNNRNKRALSNYDRLNFNLKLVAYPGAQNELMAAVGVYRSAFGLPPAVALVKPRYWRFRDWDRDLFSAGGLHSLSSTLSFLWRGYWVRYNNRLEQYKDSSLSTLQALSTYRNDLLGLFCLADYSPKQNLRLRVSLSHRQETARIQDNSSLPFQHFRHQTSSLALESELAVNPLWRLITGFSLDRLHKAGGASLVRLNPLAGAVISPADYFSLRFSVSLKSRFPSMQSLYSSLVGNPDLGNEKGQAVEAGIAWDRWASFKLTAFSNRFRNLIEAVRLADGTRRFRNVSSAKINGVEAELKKSVSWFSLAVTAHWLKHQNETENRPLDTLPSRQVNFQFSLEPWRKIRLTLSTLAASHSFWYDFTSRQLLTIPAYETIDVIISYERAPFKVYFKTTNLLNKSFYTEPGFPWRGRYLETGFSLDLF